MWKSVNNSKSIDVYLFVVTLIACIGVGFVYIQDTQEKYEEQARAHIIGLAESAEVFIPPDLVNQLEGNEKDLSSPAYTYVKDGLTRFSDRNQGVYFAYLYGERGGRLTLLADSGLSDTGKPPPPGRGYVEDSPLIDRVFTTAETVISTDEGHWVSAFVPVMDSQKENVIAVFGVDYPSAYYHQEIHKHVLHAAFAAACVFLLSAALWSMLIKNRTLRSLSTKLQASESIFRTVFEQAPVGIAIARNNRFVSHINPELERILGKPREELTSIPLTEILHPDDIQEDQEQFAEFKEDGTWAKSLIKRFIKPDGSVGWVNIICASLHVHNHNDLSSGQNYLCIIEDISKRISTEKALRESERSKSVLLANLPGLAYRCLYDRDWTMEFVSEGCYDLTGYPPESLLYNKQLSFNELIAPEYRDVLWREWERILVLRRPFRHEYEIITATGHRKWVLELGQGVYDEKGNVEALEGIIIDITEQKKGQATIKYMGDHDLMTGLYNRRYFEEAKNRLDTEEYLPLSIIIADINGMRLINNAFGHKEGNRVIIETGNLIQSCCGESDVVARTGGSEFSILLPNTNNEQAVTLLRKINNACEVFNKKNISRTYDISLSMGCSTKEKSTENLDEKLKAAEDYMLNSKLLNRKSSHYTLLNSIMATMYERSQETKEHAERIAVLSKMIGKKLNLPENNLDELELFSMLHDIGKVGIDDRILSKPGKLNDEEWAVMKTHPEIGYRIAMSSPEFKSVAPYILSHHERWDGKGYPQGLKGKDIPLLSRILAVADAFDAMTEDRVYRKALSKKVAIEKIRTNAGTQFDPEIALIFVELMEENEIPYLQSNGSNGSVSKDLR